MVNLAFDPIKVSDFYIDGKDKYKFRAQAYEENKLVAEAVFLFKFKPRDLTVMGRIEMDAPLSSQAFIFLGEEKTGAPNVQVQLVFTYVPKEYASKTPSSMTTTTDDLGLYKFNVPPGSKYNIIVNNIEYDGKVYTSPPGQDSSSIYIGPPP